MTRKLVQPLVAQYSRNAFEARRRIRRIDDARYATAFVVARLSKLVVPFRAPSGGDGGPAAPTAVAFGGRSGVLKPGAAAGFAVLANGLAAAIFGRSVNHEVNRRSCQMPRKSYQRAGCRLRHVDVWARK